MFLDIAYLTRNRDDFLNITGVLALPRVFMGKPFTDLVQSNAYGALKCLTRKSPTCHPGKCVL